MDEAGRWRRQNPGELETKITADIGSVTKMKEEFIQAGVTQFGSGWCWLAVEDGKIVVMKTLNGENPSCTAASPFSLRCLGALLLYRLPQPTARVLKAFVDHLVNWEYVTEMYGQPPNHIQRRALTRYQAGFEKPEHCGCNLSERSR